MIHTILDHHRTPHGGIYELIVTPVTIRILNVRQTSLVTIVTIMVYLRITTSLSDKTVTRKVFKDDR